MVCGATSRCNINVFTPPEPTALGVKPLLWVCGLQKNTGPRNSLAVCSHIVGRTREGMMTGLVFVGLGSAGPKYPNSGLRSVRGGGWTNLPGRGLWWQGYRGERAVSQVCLGQRHSGAATRTPASGESCHTASGACYFSRVWLWDPMDCSPPGSTVHGTF